MEWKVDLKEVEALRSWYRKQPKLIRNAAGMMLNNFAFGVKREAAAQIQKTMTVRNVAFVNSRLRVTKARIFDPINSQRSSTGSVTAARFTGWTEQELGTTTDRKRTATIAGRGGSKSGQLRPSNRLKTGNTVVKIGDYNPRGGSTNWGGFLAMLFRKKERGIIMINHGFYKLPSKLRELPGPTRSKKGGSTASIALHRRLDLVQETSHKQPKQIHWLRQARAIYFKKTDTQQMWNDTLKRLMTPPPKR